MNETNSSSDADKQTDKQTAKR